MLKCFFNNYNVHKTRSFTEITEHFIHFILVSKLRMHVTKLRITLFSFLAVAIFLKIRLHYFKHTAIYMEIKQCTTLNI